MKNTQDLLHGNIRRELIALTIPLVLGNILQQCCGQHHESVYLYSQWWM